MRNIHVVPSRNPVGIHLLDFHITSDEEIKEGDWTINTKGANEIYKVASFNGGVPLDKNGNGGLFTKKIILTTDQDLIKDGVQAIPDDFLNWFIKNPTCDTVEIKQEKLHIGEVVDESYPKNFLDYKIIIPKEEPKQDEGEFSYEEVRIIAYKAYCIGQLDDPTEGKFNKWIQQFKK